MRTTEGGTGTRGKAEIYRCFLVRCRLQGDAPPVWRFTVQQAGVGGARGSFTSFDDVATYMQAELASCGALAAGETESTFTPGAAAQCRPYNGVQERAQTCASKRSKP
jgi:hypothetical protein